MELEPERGRGRRLVATHEFEKRRREECEKSARHGLETRRKKNKKEKKEKRREGGGGGEVAERCKRIT